VLRQRDLRLQSRKRFHVTSTSGLTASRLNGRISQRSLRGHEVQFPRAPPWSAAEATTGACEPRVILDLASACDIEIQRGLVSFWTSAAVPGSNPAPRHDGDWDSIPERHASPHMTRRSQSALRGAPPLSPPAGMGS
jgi:hypothetical protein